jgi:membrane-associated tyrosine/threonine-specific cdc2-inhibitory kinase
MFADFPTPDLDFDNPCDSCPILYSHCPSSIHSLSKSESEELFDQHGLTLASDNPLRCTSNSSVYIATSSYDNRLYAVKITSNHHHVQAEYLKRAELPDSQYLVGIVALFQICSKSILQMEFCQLGDISLIQFTERIIWHMIHDIGSALHLIHAAGWMHLDVSPGNILSDDRYFKLADFGTLTKIGKFTEGCEGAGPYVSAEELAFPFGKYPVTEKTDIFSFGVVLLECISGKSAPRGGSDGYGRLRRGELRLGWKPYECRCSEELREIVNAMLRIDPNERPTANDLVEQALNYF